jgi:hypothetical protein
VSKTVTAAARLSRLNRRSSPIRVIEYGDGHVTILKHGILFT